MTIRTYTKIIADEMFRLLLAADPYENAVSSHIGDATVVVSRNGDELLGIGVLTDSNGNFETKNLSVKKSYQKTDKHIRINIYKTLDYYHG